MRRMYCIYDRVAATFIGQLVVDRADGPVIRMFHDLCGDGQSSLSQHPGDYDLLLIGMIADNGQITAEALVTVATGAAWAAAQEKR